MYINQNFIFMKKLFIITTILLFNLLQLSSCSKDDDQTNNPIIENQVDVYVTGTKDKKACYWKNGQIVILESGTFPYTEANKIIVSNGNVYVLGLAREPNKHSNLFWKNGILTNLQTTLASADEKLSTFGIDMEVAGNDVYFIGYVRNTTSTYTFNYWKNNIKTVLSDSVTTLTNGIKIKVVSNTIYITGTNSNKIGYYINTDFYELDSNNRLVQKNSDIYLHSWVAGASIAELKNLNTNISSTFPVNDVVYKMTFDNNTFYYQERYKLYKEGAILIVNNVLDFNVLNNNVYKIIGDFFTNDPRSLQINDTNIMTSTAGERFISLFIAQN